VHKIMRCFMTWACVSLFIYSFSFSWLIPIRAKFPPEYVDVIHGYTLQRGSVGGSDIDRDSEMMPLTQHVHDQTTCGDDFAYSECIEPDNDVVVALPNSNTERLLPPGSNATTSRSSSCSSLVDGENQPVTGASVALSRSSSSNSTSTTPMHGTNVRMGSSTSNGCVTQHSVRKRGVTSTTASGVISYTAAADTISKQ